MKKILLLEPDKEQSEGFVKWLKEANYEVKLVNDVRDVLPSLSTEKFGSVMLDIDTKDRVMELNLEIKKDIRFSDIPLFVLIYKTRVKKIAAFINAGVEGLLFKPFDVDDFSNRLKALMKEAEFAERGKKLLDQNYINSLIELVAGAERESFFLLVPVIFNKLILAKINTILGEPIITQIIKRCNELIGKDYAFMKEVKFSSAQIFLDGVDKASKGAEVKRLTIAFRDYVYAFLHLIQTLTSDILMERQEALG